MSRIWTWFQEFSWTRVGEQVIAGAALALGGLLLVALWTFVPQWLDLLLKNVSPEPVQGVLGVQLQFAPANFSVSLLVIIGVVAYFLRRGATQPNTPRVHKVVFFNEEYPTAFVDNPTAVRDFFVKRGFRPVSAARLRAWMGDRIRKGDAPLSLVVFAQDMVPDTVAEVPNQTCTARRYMDAGGRITWQGDVPFFYQGRSGKRRKTWGVTGCIGVLGVRPHPQTLWHGPPFPQLTQLTEDGKKRGHSGLDRLDRPVESADVTTIFTEDPQRGCACSWHKNFNLE